MRNIGVSSTPPGKLHPAELAYLLRPGDTTHCLIVLLVDAVQKVAKSQTQGAPGGGTQLSQPAYEAEIWSSVKDYVQAWSTQKVQQLIPELKSKNPIKIVSGIWRFRLWLWNVLTGLLDEIVKDPRHLRKYFSPTALLRLFVSVAGAGMKDKIAGEVRDNLRAKDLLISEKRRGQFATLFSVLALLILSAPICTLIFFAGISSGQAASLLVLSALNGLGLRILIEIPILLPYYGDIAQVLDLVKKKGIRVAILKLVLKFSRGVFFTLLVVLSCVILSIQSLLLMGFFHADFALNLLVLVIASANFALIFELLLQAYQIANIEQLSSQGQAIVDAEHAEIQKLKLTELLSDAMSSPDYNQELSDLVAVYGVETLLLIA